MRTWVAFGKEWGNLGASPIVDLFALRIMDALERLDHPINTPMEIHDYQDKKEHKKNEAHQKNRHVGKKYAVIDRKQAHLATLGP